MRHKKIECCHPRTKRSLHTVNPFAYTNSLPPCDEPMARQPCSSPAKIKIRSNLFPLSQNRWASPHTIGTAIANACYFALNRNARWRKYRTAKPFSKNRNGALPHQKTNTFSAVKQDFCAPIQHRAVTSSQKDAIAAKKVVLAPRKAHLFAVFCTTLFVFCHFCTSQLTRGINLKPRA